MVMDMAKLWLHREYEMTWQRADSRGAGMPGTFEKASLRAILGEALKRGAVYISVDDKGRVLIDGLDWAEAWEPVKGGE